MESIAIDNKPVKINGEIEWNQTSCNAISSKIDCKKSRNLLPTLK